MMRVLLVTFGSTGDVLPIISLAQTLRRNGHEPRVALPRHLVQHASQHGIPLVPIGPDLSEMSRIHQVRISEGTYSRDDARERNAMMAKMGPQAIPALCRLAATSDVIISLYSVPFIDAVHRATGTPVVIVRSVYPEFETPLRDEVEDCIHGTGRFRPALVLFALSRLVYAPPAGSPDNWRLVGFFFGETPPFEPPAELTRFIEEGQPPVVINMGSMMHADPGKVTAIFLEAVNRVGCRAILQSGWSGLARDVPLPPAVLIANYVPHTWLFPRAACVVHHGGIGTTAAALRDGVGMVIVPHSLDQFTIAERVSALGCVGGVRPFSELNPDSLAESIAKVIGSAEIRSAACAASEVVRSERGVDVACELLEQSVGQHTATEGTQSKERNGAE